MLQADLAPTDGVFARPDPLKLVVAIVAGGGLTALVAWVLLSLSS